MSSPAQQPLWESRAFSLPELVIVLGLILVLVGLALPSIAKSRQKSIELACLSRVHELGRCVLLYTMDARDSFPATRSDDPSLLITQRDRLRYANQLFRLLTSDMWRDTSGVAGTSPIYRCPANTPARQQGWNYPIDRRLSASLFVRPEYLDPRFPSGLMGQQLGARVQRLSAVVFPDAKAGLFEADVWHAYRRYAAPGLPVGTLDYRESTSPGSVWFLDGHALPMFPRDALPAVARGSYWGQTPFGTTEWGVRGRDRR